MDAAEGMCLTSDPLRRLVVLLAASNGGEPIRGRIKLQKIVFMLTHRKGWKCGPCGYVAGGYGPHSDIVEEEASRLEDAGILRTDGEDVSITHLGGEVAGRIADGEDRCALARIDECKDVFNGMTADEILAYVYSTYPDMAARSPTYDRIMSDKERHTVSMLVKGKIALGRAAEILDRPAEDVREMAGRMRVQAAR